jgi:hypothetical protein
MAAASAAGRNDGLAKEKGRVDLFIARTPSRQTNINNGVASADSIAIIDGADRFGDDLTVY